MPSSRQALITRRAISPRLAIKTLRSIGTLRSGVSVVSVTSGVSQRSYALKLAPPTPLAPLSLRANGKQGLTVLHGLAVGDHGFDNLATGISFDLVHQLHGLDDADNLALLHVVSGTD